MTVTGAGGSGKTRLAVEVAARLAEEGTGGAFFVELAPVSEPGQVPAAVATAIGVLEQPGRPLPEVLAEALGGQDLLIVMDNCEHVIGAAAELAEMLNRSCPRVRLLATSREPLGIGGEHVYRLAPLSLPAEDATSLEDLERSDAVKLFVERARSYDSTFSLDEPVAGLVASICRTLDGIPLALELAAARVPGMSLTDLDQRLDRRFRLLTGGSRTALPRQRTLQATFDWSFQLLSPAEQVVLMAVVGLFRQLRAGGSRSGVLSRGGERRRCGRPGRLAGRQEPRRGAALLRLAPLLAVGDGPPVRCRAAVGDRRRSCPGKSEICPRRVLLAARRARRAHDPGSGPGPLVEEARP